MSITPQHHDLRLTEDADLPYFVVGGRYTDTSFAALVDPDPVEGPFDDYDDAVDVWRANSMRHIDEAFVRYLIVHADSPEDASSHAQQPPHHRTALSA